MNPAAADPAYMATLTVGYGLAAVLSVLVGVVLFGLRARYPRAHLATWAAGFAASAVSQAASAASLALHDHGAGLALRTAVSALAAVGAWLFAALLVAGAEELDQGRPLPASTRTWLVVGLAALALVLVLATIDATAAIRQVVRVGLRSLVVAIGFSAAALLILRRHRARLGARIVAGAFGVSAFLQGAVAAVFAVRLANPEFRQAVVFAYAPAGDVAVVATLGIGLVIWLLEEERAHTLALAAERQRAEAERTVLLDQLRQSQKMEAVGRLAGGIAHDIKNLLAVIESWLEPLAKGAPAPDRSEALGQIMAAHRRAVRLSRQLLTFARSQPFHPRRFDLAELVRDTASLLPKSLPARATLAVEAPAPAPVDADPDQLAQALMNLALNARDAIAEGGRIVLRVDVRELNAPAWLGPDTAPPGTYAVLEVEDDGVGIEEAALSRLFEPFYTTKPRGQGTGLGLSTAYGAVRQSGGYIGARSAVGKGTTFTIVVPLAGAEQATGALPAANAGR
ncbi:MAG: ATP-binding protein [Anaeromyxobacter sp.]